METGLHKYFGELIDPRMDRTKKHPLLNIIIIAICGVICGAENWVAIERFARSKEAWFCTFLDLSEGIPSHDTFNRVFSLLDSQAFGRQFMAWANSLSATIKTVISLDGKALRATKDEVNGLGCFYLVNAWCSANGLALGQIKVDSKSNEITAIPGLLELLELEGTVVTMDAMGCQKKIAAHIIEKKADYVLSLKGNHGNLHDDIRLYMQSIENKTLKKQWDYHRTIDGEHGRIETRECWVSNDLSWLEEASNWAGLSSVAMLKSTREICDEVSVEYRYYICSLTQGNAEQCARFIRQHWGVENGLHWCLDVAFNEDRSRSKIGHCAENIGMLNKIALNLLKKETSAKVGIKTKRLMAGWDHEYLLKILAA